MIHLINKGKNVKRNVIFNVLITDEMLDEFGVEFQNIRKEEKDTYLTFEKFVDYKMRKLGYKK